MPPKRYSIYASAALDKALAERLRPDDLGDGYPSRSGIITAMCDRYHEICRRSLPCLPLKHWLLICDALHGTVAWDHPLAAATVLASNVEDVCTRHDAHGKWQVDDWPDLVATLQRLPFASQIAVVDVAERFWLQHVQPAAPEPTAADPCAPWRPTLRRLVGRLADD